MNERIQNAFKTLGFELEAVGDAGYHFNYEGVHFLWLTNEDETFLNIVIPNIVEKDEIDELVYYQVMDKLNSTLKYTKANTVNDAMWLCYERELVGDEDFEEILRRMIVHLEHSYRFLHETKDSDNDTEDFIEDAELADENAETEE